MQYLDYTKLPAILDSEYADSRPSRMVGTIQRADSGYLDIVRFYGTQALDPSSVLIGYGSDAYQVTDPVIAEFASDVEAQLRREGRLYDGPMSMKLASRSLDSSAPTVTVQPVSYGLQAATCFALDLPHPLFLAHGGTLRDYWYATRRSRVVEENPLAICLGVCGYLVVEEEGRRYLLQVRRSPKLASLEGSLGPSVAGVVDYAETCSNLRELLRLALMQEVTEEIGLCPGEYEMVPLAWAIEVFRGERPQLFAFLKTPLSRARISQRLELIPAGRKEFDAYEFPELRDGVLLADDLPMNLNPEAGMAYLLLQEFLSASGEK
jgi:hypothetical protein